MAPPPHALVRGLAALAFCALAALAGCDGGDDRNGDSQQIETLAGGINLGDGGPATATFLFPTNVTVDSRGDVLVVDANHVLGHWLLRRIDERTGRITTIGGPCDPFTFVDQPGRLCELSSFTAIATRGPDEVFVAGHDQKVYRVDTAIGTFEHIAGRAAFDCSDGDGAAPIDACLGYANDAAVDGDGNLYLADITGVIRRLDRSLDRLTVVAGTIGGGCIDPATSSEPIPATKACLAPTAVAIDERGTIYVANRDARRLDRIDADSGLLTVVAGGRSQCDGERGDGGPPALACFADPTGIAAAADGAVFVADGDRIRRIDGDGRTITTVGRRDFIERLAVAPGGIVFTEGATGRVSRLDLESGTITTIAGNETASLCGDGGPAEAACIGQPTGIAFAPDGGVLFADVENGRLGRVDTARHVVTTLADHLTVGSCGDVGPRPDVCLANPTDLVRDRDGSLYFADRGFGEEDEDDAVPGRIRRLDPATGTISTIAGNCLVRGSTRALDACVLRPYALLLDGRGGLYVGGDDGVHRIDLPSSTIRDVVGGRRLADDCLADDIDAVDACTGAWDLALDESENLYVVDLSDARVRRVDAATGTIRTVAGGADFVDGCLDDDLPATSACLVPVAIVVDDDRLFIASDGSLRVVDLASGLIRTTAGSPAQCGFAAPPSPGCVFPFHMELDRAGRFVLSEGITRSIRRVTLP